jgi:hypothetical protein
LALVRTTAEKDEYLLAFFPKIHSVTGAEIDFALVNASPYTFGVGKVPQPNAV